MNFYEISDDGVAVAWVLAPTPARALRLLRRGADAVARELPREDVGADLLDRALARHWREGLLLLATGATA